MGLKVALSQKCHFRVQVIKVNSYEANLIYEWQVV